MANLLSICQAAAAYIGLPQPASIIGSSDETAIRLKTVANDEGQDLARRANWQELTKEATFLAQAQEDQGFFSSLGSGGADYSDMDRVIPNTLWDRTEDIRVYGPLSPAEFQTLKSSTTSGPYWSFRIRGNKLLAYPNPTAGNTIAFEYVSKWWVDTDDDGVGEADEFASDTDKTILDDKLIRLGIIWRYKQSVGEDYAEDYKTYEMQVANAIARSGSSRTLHLGGTGGHGVRPGIFVPEGNWSP